MPLHQEEVVEWISYAYGKNHYEADPELRDLLRHFWPGAGDREAELLAWGAYMGREVYEAAYHIDQDAGPELVMHDLDGNRVDRVRLSPVQREVLKRLRPIVRPQCPLRRHHARDLADDVMRAGEFTWGERGPRGVQLLQFHRAQKFRSELARRGLAVVAQFLVFAAR